MIETLAGYVRDLVSAVLGLLILFGVGLTNDQIAGILLVVTTAFAFGSYAYGKWQAGNGRRKTKRTGA